MIKQLIWTIWTPVSSVLKKADKLNLSLSLFLSALGLGELKLLKQHIMLDFGYNRITVLQQ